MKCQEKRGRKRSEISSTITRVVHEQVAVGRKKNTISRANITSGRGYHVGIICLYKPVNTGETWLKRKHSSS